MSSEEDIERKQMEILVTGQKRALELLIEDAPLSHVLDTLVLMIEELGILTAILLLDKEGLHLRYAAAPGLPANYTRAMDGFTVGPRAGSCGAAIYRREAVYVSDIANDPLWVDYKDLALSYGLQACWSIPILSSNGKVLGTFAIYYREPRFPSEHEKHLIDLVTHTAAIAIERKQTEEQLKESEERFRSLSRSSPVGIFLTDTQGNTHIRIPAVRRLVALLLRKFRAGMDALCPTLMILRHYEQCGQR